MRAKVLFVVAVLAISARVVSAQEMSSAILNLETIERRRELELNNSRLCSKRQRLTQRQPVASLGGRFGAVERKIRVFLQKTLVVGKKFHGVVRLQAIAFDRGVDLRFEKAH